MFWIKYDSSFMSFMRIAAVLMLSTLANSVSDNAPRSNRVPIWFGCFEAFTTRFFGRVNDETNSTSGEGHNTQGLPVSDQTTNLGENVGGSGPVVQSPLPTDTRGYASHVSGIWTQQSGKSVNVEHHGKKGSKHLESSKQGKDRVRFPIPEESIVSDPNVDSCIFGVVSP